MSSTNTMSAFEAMGEAQLLAITGQREMMELLGRTVSRVFRSLVGRTSDRTLAA